LLADCKTDAAVNSFDTVCSGAALLICCFGSDPEVFLGGKLAVFFHSL
jgi:hypothetical protein